MQWVYVDIFEAESFARALSQGLTVHRQNLVPAGVGDIFWVAQGKKYSLEHKTLPSVFSEMGHRLDTQLRKHLDHADIVALIMDGVVTPIPGERRCQVWVQNRQNNIWHKGRIINYAWEDLQSYIFSLTNLGIQVYTSPTEEALAKSVMAMVYNSHKPSHNTLQQHTKQKKLLWSPNPHIETLMGLSGARIGEATAKKLLDSYPSPYSIFIAPNSDNKIPKDLWSRIKSAIGRTT